MKRNAILAGIALLIGAVIWAVSLVDPVGSHHGRVPRAWEKLATEPCLKKQDDISLIDPETGWYINSIGKIFKTENGGATWKEMVNKPGTYWRTIAFLDERHGFAGNIGPGVIEGMKSIVAPDDFENLNKEVNITDSTLVYETNDGGATWQPADLPPNDAKGICSISTVATTPRLVFAGGRVTGPACLFRWTEGKGWDKIRLPVECAMVLDVHFFDPAHGIICSASDPDPAKSNASIFLTRDAGLTWEKRYQSTRPAESVWKCSFPTRQVGYATIRVFDPRVEVKQRFIVKTVDGGVTWTEVLVTEDFECRPQGIGFLTPDHGWVGTTGDGFETTDGGKTWGRVLMGKSVNRVRIVPVAAGGVVVYAIGQELHKLRIR